MPLIALEPAVSGGTVNVRGAALEGRWPGCDDARVRLLIPKLDPVFRGNVAVSLLIAGKDAAEIVDSVGDTGPTDGGPGVFIIMRRMEIVPSPGDALMSGGLPVGVVPSDRIRSPRGRGVLNWPGLCGDSGSARGTAVVRGVEGEFPEEGVGGKGCGSGIGNSLSLETSDPDLITNRLEPSMYVGKPSTGRSNSS